MCKAQAAPPAFPGYQWNKPEIDTDRRARGWRRSWPYTTTSSASGADLWPWLQKQWRKWRRQSGRPAHPGVRQISAAEAGLAGAADQLARAVYLVRAPAGCRQKTREGPSAQVVAQERPESGAYRAPAQLIRVP